MIDIYNEVISRFLHHLGDKDDIRCIILDGSVNNREHIYGLSDIDLKVFVKGNAVHQESFDVIQRAIQMSLHGHNIIFNAWTLLETEYPRTKVNSVFDYVRRYCLLKGTILYSDNFKPGNIDLMNIGEEERRDCLRAIFNFQIRLRRLLTNAQAITDVNAPSSDFLLQQSIAYLFHSIRYFNAFYGIVCCKIKDVATSFATLWDCDQDIHFVNEMYTLRLNWNSRSREQSDGRVILSQTTIFIDKLSAKMRADFNNDIISILYK